MTGFSYFLIHLKFLIPIYGGNIKIPVYEPNA